MTNTAYIMLVLDGSKVESSLERLLLKENKDDQLFQNIENEDKEQLSEGDKNSSVLYIQMEYCTNKTLRDLIDQGGIDEKDAWRLFRQIVEGLAHIHSQGMIHRDLKPSNIFIDAKGDAKVMLYSRILYMRNTMASLGCM